MVVPEAEVDAAIVRSALCTLDVLVCKYRSDRWFFKSSWTNWVSQGRFRPDCSLLNGNSQPQFERASTHLQRKASGCNHQPTSCSKRSWKADNGADLTDAELGRRRHTFMPLHHSPAVGRPTPNRMVNSGGVSPDPEDEQAPSPNALRGARGRVIFPFQWLFLDL